MIIQRFNPWVGKFLSINFILSQDFATCSCSSCLKFVIKVLREIIFAGGKYLVIKESLHLFQELILLWGKEENQIFAESRKKMEIISSWPHHCPHLFFFCISHNSMKVLRWDTTSSLGVPTNWSFMTRFSKAVLISQDSALVAGAIRVLIKSLLLVFEKSHNLVLSWVMVTTQQDCTQKQIWWENGKRKRGRIKRQIFVKWGRGKQEANGK